MSNVSLPLRKIADLDGDELCDFGVAISPIIPLILDMEIVKMQIFGAVSEGMAEARAEFLHENEKKKKDETRLSKAMERLTSESADMAIRDVTAIIPKILSREYRGFVFEGLSVLSGVSVEEIKKLKAGKLIDALWRVKNDINLKDFLPSADTSVQTE